MQQELADLLREAACLWMAGGKITPDLKFRMVETVAEATGQTPEAVANDWDFRANGIKPELLRQNCRDLAAAAGASPPPLAPRRRA